MQDLSVTLRDGRTLSDVDMGDPNGPHFHGAPGSRLDAGFDDLQFAARAVRVVAPDRSGYGGCGDRQRDRATPPASKISASASIERR